MMLWLLLRVSLHHPQRTLGHTMPQGRQSRLLRVPFSLLAQQSLQVPCMLGVRRPSPTLPLLLLLPWLLQLQQARAAW
jgi:hypothetical protein